MITTVPECSFDNFYIDYVTLKKIRWPYSRVPIFCIFLKSVIPRHSEAAHFYKSIYNIWQSYIFFKCNDHYFVILFHGLKIPTMKWNWKSRTENSTMTEYRQPGDRVPGKKIYFNISQIVFSKYFKCTYPGESNPTISAWYLKTWPRYSIQTCDNPFILATDKMFVIVSIFNTKASLRFSDTVGSEFET